MVNVAVIGVGFVGLAHAAVLARFGHDVLGYDKDESKINAYSSGDSSRIESFVYENDLASLIKEQLHTGRLKFSTDISKIKNCEVYFLCLPTPYMTTGESDLTYLFTAIKELSEVLKDNTNFKLFVDKSTVPIGTAKKVFDMLKSYDVTNYDVCSNPEFLPEGEAVEYSIHSTKIIVGATKDESFSLLRKVYASFYDSPNCTYIETSPETAEAIKYASNVLLYSQIVMWQAIPGKIAESFSEVDFDILRKGALADPRIAKWGSYVSAGVGGSCFKKDTLSLAFQLEKKSASADFVKLIDVINEKQKTYLIERAITESGFDFKGKVISILGLSFKQGTNDTRESNVLKLIPSLLSHDVAQIRIYDPVVNGDDKEIKSLGNIDKILYCNNVKLALENADSAFIATDHQEFRSLAETIISNTKRPFIVIDGRRMIPKQDVMNLLSSGISYLPVAGVFRKAGN